jgi:hypothetical protein
LHRSKTRLGSRRACEGWRTPDKPRVRLRETVTCRGRKDRRRFRHSRPTSSASDRITPATQESTDEFLTSAPQSSRKRESLNADSHWDGRRRRSGHATENRQGNRK